MANFCGGIKLGESLAVKNGIICIASEEPETDNVVTPCGMLFSGNDFEVLKVDGRYVLSSVHTDEEQDIQVLVRTNCGILANGNYFSINENGALEYEDAYILEVVVEPHDTTITVAYGDAATPVEPIQGTTNMFKLTEVDETYTITASKEGYTSQEQQITADQNHIVEFTLVAAGG